VWLECRLSVVCTNLKSVRQPPSDVTGIGNYSNRFSEFMMHPREVGYDDTLFDSTLLTVPTVHCLKYPQLRLPSKRRCYSVCPSQWETPAFVVPSEFRQCTAECGGGVMTRSLDCLVRNETTLIRSIKGVIETEPDYDILLPQEGVDRNDVVSYCPAAVSVNPVTSLPCNTFPCTSPTIRNATPVLSNGSVVDAVGSPVIYQANGTLCSQECGTGLQYPTVACRRATGLIAPLSSCGIVSPLTYATQHTRPCNTRPCLAYHYETTEYGVCNPNCTSLSSSFSVGFKTRDAWCATEFGKVIYDSYCFAILVDKPPTVTQCTSKPCVTYILKVKSWKPLERPGPTLFLQSRPLLCCLADRPMELVFVNVWCWNNDAEYDVYWSNSKWDGVFCASDIVCGQHKCDSPHNRTL
jgi:hypothetical protein